MRRSLAVASLAAALLAAAPATAGAHALLDRTTPDSGSELSRPPESVAFYFSEPVEASFGAVRVFDEAGEQVESGAIERPGESSDAVSVSLPPSLPDGTYTATYRVISADSHPVSGGLVFSIGEGGGGPAQTVSELLDDSDSGAVTGVAFWAARWVGYAAVGLAAGTIFFLVCVWSPALRRAAGAEDEWSDAAGTFARRIRTLLVWTAVAGLLSSLAAIVLQGATAAGSSFWSALDPEVIGDVLETRYGSLAGLRAIAWGVFCLAVLWPGLRPASAMRPARLGAAGAVPTSLPVATLALLVLPLAVLLATPALGGHAATQDPSWLLVPADLVHVTAMSAWIGGLVLFAVAVPAATRRLATGDRSRLLASALDRFSPLALACVLALAATGIAQAIVYLGAVDDLVDTGFGRAVAIKAALLALLVGFGALNRRRSLPELRRIADRGDSPSRTGVVLRRTIRAEVALLLAVLAVTAALVSYAPPSEADAGPASGSTEIGSSVLEYTVDPAQVGDNKVHLYLFDAETGEQSHHAMGVRVDLALPAEGIGPIEAELRRAGPGHYVAPAAPFGVPGDWTMDVSLRVSKFESADAQVEVPIE